MAQVNFKVVSERLNRKAEEHLPLLFRQSKHSAYASWCEMHGWDSKAAEIRLLVSRQIALMAMLRQTFPQIRFFPTPFDELSNRYTSDFQVPDVSSEFNFWGEVYNALVPQPHRRIIGQFWTSELVADWMVSWLLHSNPRQLEDVGCGTGGFLLQAGRKIQQNNLETKLRGYDISPLILNIALANIAASGLPIPQLASQNYLTGSLSPETDAVVCNPPYTRHHHISPSLKDGLQRLFELRLHVSVSRLATMATYFLLKILAEIPRGARMAIIIPMEVLDARYGKITKQVLARETRLSAIVHFAPDMNAFAKVDVGACILFLEKGSGSNHLVRHLTLRALPSTDSLLSALCLEETQELEFGSLIVQPQDALDREQKWFSIAVPQPALTAWQETGLVVPLKELAVVMRGIATGANEFFALPTAEVDHRSLRAYVVPTIQRNREIQEILLDYPHWECLSEAGKRVWLLYLDGMDISKVSALRKYIQEGERRGYHKRSLVNTRKRWYIMEQRRVPPIFFTILTRGNPRFILNRAGVRPLNMFSLVYPNRVVEENDCVEILWALLNSSFSISKLHSVSRTYGGKTLKVEPRELDNLPVINPFALSFEERAELKAMIAEFESQRGSVAFLASVNALVEDVLHRARPPVQLVIRAKQLALLESKGQYSHKDET